MSNIMTQEEWEGFVKGDLINLVTAKQLQKLSVEDGAGKKGVIKVNASGEIKVQITVNETL